MKTIVHIELSDEARNDWAKRIDRDPDTKRLVTRKEVTEQVNFFVDEEIRRGWEDDQDPQLEEVLAARKKLDEQPVPEDVVPMFTPSRGDEPYLAQPRNPDIAAACSRILDDAALIENFAWDTIERNRK